MEGSGGTLQLAAQTFRHFSASVNSGASGRQELSVPNRVKSVKSIFFKQTDTGMRSGVAENRGFPASCGITNGITSYQFRIGSVLYPSQAVAVSDLASGNNKAESLYELRKAFGNLNFIDGTGSLLNGQTYAKCDVVGSVGMPILNDLTSNKHFQFAPMGLDFEAFPRTALESGVNTADFSLPTNLILEGGTFTNDTTIDVYVLADALFYVNLDGSVSVSV